MQSTLVQGEQVTYQFNTGNESFIKLYRQLKDKGIKNNKFFLRLYDKSLENINPFSPNLTKLQVGKITKEIRINPWYYYREVCRVKVPGGAKKFQIHRGNLAILWSLHNNLNTSAELPRQQGKTIAVIAAFSWVYCFGTTKSDATFSNKTLDDSQLNIKRLKDMIELLPACLQHRNPIKDVDNVGRIASHTTRNTVTALATASDIIKADMLGRGLTAPLLFFDEFAFLLYNSTILNSAAPAFSTASEEAEANGKPYFKVIITTPNNVDIPQGKFCHELFSDAAAFIEEMYDMSKQDVAAYIAKYSKNDFVHIRFTWQELGRDNAWYSKQCRALNNDIATIKRELDLTWARTTDASIFSEEEIDTLGVYTADIIDKAHLNNYFINFVTPLDRSKQYILGVDCATGVSRDSTSITFTDYESGKIVGNFHNNKIDTDELFHLICDIMLHLTPTAVLAIERNSVGVAVIDRLLKTMWAKNLFYTLKEGDGKTSGKRKTRKTSQQGTTKIYGINTSVSTRPVMIDLLRYEVTNNPEIFTMECITKEIATLIRNKRGKIEHASGCHDDNIFSFLMTRYAMTFNEIIGKLIKGNSNGAEASKSFSTISSFNSLKSDNTVKQNTNTRTQTADTTADSATSKRRKGMSAILALNG